MTYDLWRYFVRFGKPVTASLCVAGVGLLAVGCSSGSSASSVSASGTAQATTTSAASASAAATSMPTQPAAPASTQPAASAGTCQVSVLSFALGAKTGAAGQQTTQVVDLTNKGSATCTMEGFPGVDLVGSANGQQSYSWPLERSSARYGQLTLQPGGTAHFDLTYLPFASGDGTDIAVAKIVLTPPNTFTQAQLTWNQQVLLQDAATHPGTFIGPVTSGA